MDTSVEDYLRELKFGLVEVVYEWACGMVKLYTQSGCSMSVQATVFPLLLIIPYLVYSD